MVNFRSRLGQLWPGQRWLRPAAAQMPRSSPPVRETPIESGILSRLGRGARAFLDIVGGFTQWLGPGQLIQPVAPRDVQIRRLDFPVGYDYTIMPRSYEPASFQQSQALADNYEFLRIAIETRKRQVARLPWQIRVKRQPGMTAREAQQKTLSDNRIPKLTELFRRPDRERSFRNWVNQILENMLVLDAVAIYPRFTLGGDIHVDQRRYSTWRAVPEQESTKPSGPTRARESITGIAAPEYLWEIDLDDSSEASQPLEHGPGSLKVLFVVGDNPVHKFLAQNLVLCLHGPDVGGHCPVSSTFFQSAFKPGEFLDDFQAVARCREN